MLFAVAFVLFAVVLFLILIFLVRACVMFVRLFIDLCDNLFIRSPVHRSFVPFLRLMFVNVCVVCVCVLFVTTNKERLWWRFVLFAVVLCVCCL